MEELPRNFLLNLIRAASQAAQGPMKVFIVMIEIKGSKLFQLLLQF